MKTIKVNWTDAEFQNHSFEMNVPNNESKSDIDHLVMDEIFDKAITQYEWN